MIRPGWAGAGETWADGQLRFSGLSTTAKLFVLVCLQPRRSDLFLEKAPYSDFPPQRGENGPNEFAHCSHEPMAIFLPDAETTSPSPGEGRGEGGLFSTILRFLESLHGFSAAHWAHEPFCLRRRGAGCQTCCVAGFQACVPWPLVAGGQIFSRLSRRGFSPHHLPSFQPVHGKSPCPPDLLTAHEPFCLRRRGAGCQTCCVAGFQACVPWPLVAGGQIFSRLPRRGFSPHHLPSFQPHGSWKGIKGEAWLYPAHSYCTNESANTPPF